MKKLNAFDWTSLILLIVGGLNWGLVGLFKLDLINATLGDSWLARIIYVLVGAAAVYAILMTGKMGKESQEKEA